MKTTRHMAEILSMYVHVAVLATMPFINKSIFNAKDLINKKTIS